MATSDISVEPPNAPWRRLAPAGPHRGCLSFYISDDLSRLPVRAVTLPSNNKSDPNLETGTYGLFSTCAQQMRAGVVLNDLAYLFFVTRRGGRRVLTGYYRLAWYCENLPLGSRGDFGLAADAMRFIDPPLPLRDLPESVRHRATQHFRLFSRVDAIQTSVLLRLLDARRDRTADYLTEIDRLERFNAFHTHFRCWNRTEPFSWKSAVAYLNPPTDAHEQSPPKVLNSSSSDLWICQSCTVSIENKARLRQCPSCGAVGSLRPLTKEEVKLQDRT